jgi:glutathione S-transferase
LTETIVWGRRSAFNVQKVLWGLDELGVRYMHRDAGGAAGGLDTAEFLAMNPHGRVPVLVEAGLTLWESHSILRYLGAHYAEGEVWTDVPAERAKLEAWMDWAQATLQPDFMRLFWGYYRAPVEQHVAKRIGAWVKAVDAHLQLLDQQLANQRYLAGDAFTLADIPAGTALFRYFEMGLDVPRPPNVMAWYARLCDRPAYQTNIMTDFESLRGRTTF